MTPQYWQDVEASDEPPCPAAMRDYRGSHHAVVMLDSPPVITVGRRCVQVGRAFHNYPYADPYLVTPNGKHTCCEVENFVPCMAHRHAGR